MKVTTIILGINITGIVASMFDTLLPTNTPLEDDPWQCYTESLESFFDVPKPTGKLETAIYSYINTVLDKDCQPTMTGAMGYHVCTFPPQSRWCDFTTAMPQDLSSAYSSFGSSAASWWSANSEEAVSSAEICESNWFEAMVSTPDGAYFLNETIAWAECYADAYRSHVTTEASTMTQASQSRETTLAPQATTTYSQAISTARSTESNDAARIGGLNFWFLKTVVALAVANWIR